jgi:hypothetical protein
MNYPIEIFNHITKAVEKVSFESKKEAIKFLKTNCEKRGYDYFSKTDRSIEFNRLF